MAEKIKVESDWWMHHAIFSITLWLLVFPIEMIAFGLDLTALLFLVLPLGIVVIITGIGSLFGYYFDSKAIRRSESNWRPWWIVYTIGHLLLGYFVAPIYLIRRGQKVGNNWRKLREKCPV